MTRIGIIGTGDVAHNHIIGLLTSNNYEISGCYSPENSRAMVFARQYRLISYSTPEALFKDVDTVDITDDFPETMHLAELSLKAMKHVFIARPDRLNMNQMRYLRNMAEESGTVLQFGTGYKYCPVYHLLEKSMQTAQLVDVRHQLVNSGDWYAQLINELSYDFDFVMSVLNTSIQKLDVKTCTASENAADVLHFRLECDNGCTVNMTAYTVAEGDPQLEMTFTSSDAVVRADIFKSLIERRSRTCNTVDSITLDPYNERTTHKDYLKNFYHAICNEFDALRNIDKQFQNRDAADYLGESIKLMVRYK
jgi:predicted dehydrogenase